MTFFVRIMSELFTLLYAARNKTRSNFKMAGVVSCLHCSLQKTEISFKLKTEQKECLQTIFNLKDTIALEFYELLAIHLMRVVAHIEWR